MKVKFLKDCPWSYRLTKGQRGAVIRHKAGNYAHVADSEGAAMVCAGYAEERKEGMKPGYKPEETKVVAPKELKDMSKKELEKLARTKGIELDRREKKGTLVKIVQKLIGGENA